MVSDRAQACPKCGATVGKTNPIDSTPSYYSENRNNGSLKWVIISLILVVAVLAIVIAMLLNTGASSSNEYAYEEAAASTPMSAVESSEASVPAPSEEVEETEEIEAEDDVYSLPNASTVITFVSKLNNSNNASNVTPPAGIKLLAKDMQYSSDFYSGWLVFGNDVNITGISNGNIGSITITGSHPFYFDWNNCSDAGSIIYFKSKEDSYRFLNDLKSTHYYSGQQVLYDNGWYQIFLIAGN